MEVSATGFILSHVGLANQDDDHGSRLRRKAGSLGSPVLRLWTGVLSLEFLVLSCLAKDPSLRPRSARSLQRALERLRDEVGPWTELQAAEWWQRRTTEPENLQQRPVLQLVSGTAATVDMRPRSSLQLKRGT